MESVWDYPRPPRLEPVSLPLKVVFADRTVAETTRAGAGAGACVPPPGKGMVMKLPMWMV